MRAEEYMWFFIHNAVAHPLLVLRVEWAEDLHDWTARKMAEAGGRLD